MSDKSDRYSSPNIYKIAMKNERFNLRVGETRGITGSIKAPPSKSYTHRAIIICSIDGKAKIINPLYSQDTLDTISIMEKLGAKIEKHQNYLKVTGFGGKPHLDNRQILNVGESGTLLRFVLPLVTLAAGKFTVKGKGTLNERPNNEITCALRSWGVNISGRGSEDKLPIKIQTGGSLKGGEVRVNGKMSSQVVSSLLIAAPLADNDTTIILRHKLVSRPYVDITLNVLEWAGVHVERRGYKLFKVKKGQRFMPESEFVVHGDYSSAAFLAAAGVLTKSDMSITDLVDDQQGDKEFINILCRMGAKVKRQKNAIRIKGPYRLEGIDVDCSDTPDIVPILTALAVFANGRTRIRNISHLIYKESNRIAATAGELQKLGADISFTNKELVIRGSSLRAGYVSSCNDHRVAMALAVAGLRAGGITIENAHCISKSYPLFISHMKKLGANLKVIPA